IRWARARQAFGTRLADKPVIRHKLAEMARQTDVAREYVRAVARRFTAGEDVSREAAMAKNTAVYACQWVVHAAVQIPGGMGVVAIDAQARTITVRGGGVGKDETFPVEAQALQRVGALKPGEQVVLTLRAGGPGPEVVTQIERSVASAGARGRSATGGATPRRRGP